MAPPAGPIPRRGSFFPILVGGEPIGTLWVAMHDQAHHFGADDLRIMCNLAEFTAAAHQSLRSLTIDSESQPAEEATQRLASIIENSDDAIIGKSLDGIINSWNKGAERLFGYSAEEMFGQPITGLIPPDRQDEEPEILRRIRDGERVEHYETVRQRKDGSLVHISLSVSPIRNARGKIIGASKIARDITDRRQAQANKDLLAREIQHRTKNLFAVLRAVIAQSFAGKLTVEDAQSAVLSRLYSFAQTHAILIDKKWTGASLVEVVNVELSPYAGRVSMAGPEIILTPNVAQNVAMALHELATNAAKYGALSNATGKVSVRWSVSRENGLPLLHFRWAERGGPPVTPPSRKGFGSAVLEQVMREYCQHPPQIIFETEGIRYEFHGLLDAFTGGV